MKTDYYIINPAGNITALVTSPVPKNSYGAAAARIMKKRPAVEQVGFVRFANGEAVLNMAGDEFCGNAVMSAAALYCRQKNSLSGYKTAVELSVKVTPLLLTVPAFAKPEGDLFNCGCLLPTPKNVQNVTFTANGRDYTFPAACLDGIIHIIADGTLPAAAAREVIKPLAERLKAPALGIMLYDREKAQMRPLVYVAAVDTLFFENSCASGSCAAVFVTGKTGAGTAIAQPGGVITAEKQKNGVSLNTRVKIENFCSEDI